MVDSEHNLKSWDREIRKRMIRAGVDDSVFSTAEVLEMTIQAIVNSTKPDIDDSLSDGEIERLAKEVLMSFPAEQIIDIEDGFSIDIDLLRGGLNNNNN